MVATFQTISQGGNDDGILFSRDFFSTDEFQNLYLWCDDDATEGIGQLFRKVEFDTSTSPNISTVTNEGTFTLNAGDELKCNFIAERVMPSPLPTTATVNYRSINIKLIINGVVYADVNRTYGYNLIVPIGGGSTFTELKAVMNTTFVPESAGTYTAFFQITTNASDIEQVEWFALINGTSTCLLYTSPSPRDS